MSDPSSRVRMSGPLEDCAPGFAAELSKQGYSRFSAASQMRLTAHLSRWLESEGLDAAALTPIVVEKFMAARRAAGYVDFRSSRALDPLLGYLRELGTAPAVPPVVAITPEEVFLERYRRYLTTERGLVASSARYYIDLVRPFLSTRVTDGGIDLEHLAAGDITAFVLAECPLAVSASGQAAGDRAEVPARLPARRRRDRMVTHGGGACGRRLAVGRPAEGARTRPGAPTAGQLRPAHGHRIAGLRGSDAALTAGDARR